MLKGNFVRDYICQVGLWRGYACFLIELSNDGEELDVDAIISEIISKSIQHIVIVGNASDQPDIVTIIKGLGSKGKKILFSTDAREDISPMRMVPGLQFFLRVALKGDESLVNLNCLPTLKKDDIIRFTVDGPSDYELAKQFVLSKTITQPTVVFTVTGNANILAEVTALHIASIPKYLFETRLLSV